MKSPKVYVRDSGLVHALLGIADHDALAGHPVVGASWEGFVIENLLSAVPAGTRASFYRTAAGAEIDLLLELPGGRRWAVEIKSGLSPRLEKRFHFARQDLNSEVAERLLGSACYSPARIERELGWRAGIGLDEGVREMLGAGLSLLSG